MQATPIVKSSVCPLDCPDTCSLDITVINDKITQVKGSSANPYTAGVVCKKVVKYYPDFVHGDERLCEPLRRTGKRGSLDFEPISWDEALELITRKIKDIIAQYGPQSVLPFNYAGPHGQLAGGSMDRRFFYTLGATLLDRGPLCGGVRGAAYTSLFGNAPGTPPEHAMHSDVIAVWGNNVTVSNLHFARVVKAARSKGAKLIVIDPKQTRIAQQAHLYLQIAPGTDIVLALALAAEMERREKVDQSFVKQWVFGAERFLAEARKYSLEDAALICKVPLDQLHKLADLYADAENLSTSIGNGIERGKSGGSGLRAIMSVAVLLGQIGRLGAGIIAKPGLAFPYTPEALQRPDLIPPGTRTLNIADLGRLLLEDDLDPPLRAIFIYNHNPIATHPDQNRMIRALSRPELFITGIDVVMTDSMRYCDVILPASSHFEFDDIYGAYGHSYLQRAAPVIPTVGKSLPNTEIFRRLAAAFELDHPMFQDDDDTLMNAALNAADERLPGCAISELPTDDAFLMKADPEKAVLMCNTVVPLTPSGKIELYSESLEDQFGYGIPRYTPANKDKPFTVISPSSSKRTNATFGGHEKNRSVEKVEIHPDDASKAAINDGDLINLYNAQGKVTLKAKISSAVSPGVLYTPKGTWLSTSDTGQTVNALISSKIRTDIMDGVCYNETFVEIEKAI